VNQNKDNKHSTETLKFIIVFTIKAGILHIYIWCKNMTVNCSVAATHTSCSVAATHTSSSHKSMEVREHTDPLILTSALNDNKQTASLSSHATLKVAPEQRTG
jgi:hypothetical protein